MRAGPVSPEPVLGLGGGLLLPDSASGFVLDSQAGAMVRERSYIFESHRFV